MEPAAQFRERGVCMAALDLKKEGSVYILTMINGEQSNTFTADVLEEFHGALEEIEASTGNGAVVLTSNDPRAWSTGINLEWLIAKPAAYYEEFKTLMDKFLMRWALLDMPTVGCLTGHTYAGGALLASTLDFRYMREDRGWFCFPEVDIKIPFTPLMHELVERLTDNHTIRHLLLTGKRVGGTEAAELRIVDGAYPIDDLFDKSMEMARLLAAKDRATYANIKMRMRSRIAAMKK